MNMELSDFKRKGFLPFCLEEIRQALNNGIDPKLISRYMDDTGFDNLQLRQIRLGLEQKLDVSAYARKTMPSDEMENIRERLLKEQSQRDLEAEKEKILEQQQIKTEVNRKRIHNTLSFFRLILILLFVAIGIGLVYGGKIIYDLWNEELYIDFIDDEITLEYETRFIPEKQVRDYSQGSNIMIIYPSFSADKLGEYSVTYQLSNGLRILKKDLKILVTDTTAPAITLKDDEIVLVRGDDEFIPENYIEKASDNYDADPKLAADELDWDLDEQDISYTVTDSSGNRSEAVLHVLIKDKPKAKQQNSTGVSSDESHDSYDSYDDSSSVTAAADNHSSTENNKNENYDSSTDSNPSAQENAAVYCHNVSVPLGSDPGSAAYSTYDGLTGNITVAIQYPELNTSVLGTYPVYFINQATGETVNVAYVTVTE